MSRGFESHRAHIPLHADDSGTIAHGGNTEYRKVDPSSLILDVYPGMEWVSGVIRGSLKDPSRFEIVAPEYLVSALSRTEVSKDLDAWMRYHHVRYGW